MLKILLPFIFIALSNAEPSAFELQSGATKADIKELKDAAQNSYKILTTLQSKNKALEQKVDGLETLYDSQIKQISDSTIKLSKQSEQIKNLEDENKKLKEQIKENDTNIEELEKTIFNLRDIVNQLNEIVIEKIQIDEKAKQEAGKKEKTETAKPKQTAQKPQSGFVKDKTKREEIFATGRQHYIKKEYAKAQEIFNWLIDIKYRRADSNYFLGEIAFKQKKFKEAIAYYKESATLNDKTANIPNLLLNTAKSFNELGDNGNAIKFLDSLIANYPKSKEAKEGQILKAILNKG